MTLTLAFHPRHIEAVRSKDKRLTARVKFERDTHRGESMRFLDSSNNEIFGFARVMQIYDMDIDKFIETEWEHHENYANRKDFEIEFGKYYPDVDLRQLEKVTIIEWDEMFRPNRVYDFG